MRIGIIGGLGPEATVEYYRMLVQHYKQETGRSPEVIIDSLDVDALGCLHAGDVDEKRMISLLLDAVRRLDRAGADLALIASNSPHLVFERLQERAPIPLLSIVEATCREAGRRGLKRLGLMGTLVTMRADFYQKSCADRGILVVVPSPEEQDYIQEKIATEIMLNTIKDETRRRLLAIVERMIVRDAIHGLILGCTELPLILIGDACGIPFLNTARIHVEYTVQYCLEKPTK